jgi:hypothetical protein
LKNLTQTKAFTSSITILAVVLLLTANAFAQTTGSGQQTAKVIIPVSNTTDFGTTPTAAEPKTSSVAPVRRSESDAVPLAPQTAGDDSWHFELRPYIWAAGVYGNLRVGNQVAQTGNGDSSILGMLDFAAAAQVEAIKGRWRIMIDENYVNLGTTGTGPGGNVTLDVQPTMNLLEFGGSYAFAKVANEKSTTANPLPPVFTAEVLGGVRWFHLGVQLQSNNSAPVEGSRNLIGPFVGTRLKVRPNKLITLSGKFTAGGSGAGSNFAWSGEGLIDFRLKKSFSLGGGYRVLDLNGDQPSNRVGFDGQMRGLVLNLTLYR